MVSPEIRRLQVLNDLIAQTLDVISQRTALAGGLSHSPYVPELGTAQRNPFSQYGIPPGIGPLGIGPWGAPQGVPFTMPYAQGLMHSPFVGYPQRGLETGFGYGQPPFGQFSPAAPFASPWTQGLMHSPFTQGVGFGQVSPFAPGIGFGQTSQGVPPFVYPWSGVGGGAARFGTGFGIPYF